jgi:hypothetical protein
MNYPSIPAEKAAELLQAPVDDLRYYAWPEVFGSTAGPFPGLGGASMSVFTIEAWVDEINCATLLFCNGRLIRGLTGLIDPPQVVGVDGKPVRWKR